MPPEQASDAIPSAVTFPRWQMEEDCAAAAQFLAGRLPAPPQAAVILGSGLGTFVEAIEPACSIPYRQIPGFPCSTAMGHAGYLHWTEVFGMPTVVLQGRCHLYGGYSREESTRSVRTLCGLGLQTLVVSCAAGGLNPQFDVGDLMLFDDHIDLLGNAKFSGQNQRSLRGEVYAPDWLQRAEDTAREEQLTLRRGTYVAVPGPNYETRAELRMFRQLGADAIGMSSIPEILAAHHRGVNCVGLATITNACIPDVPHQASGEAVLAAATSAEPRFRKLVLSLLARCAAEWGS